MEGGRRSQRWCRGRGIGGEDGGREEQGGMKGWGGGMVRVLTVLPPSIISHHPFSGEHFRLVCVSERIVYVCMTMVYMCVRVVCMCVCEGGVWVVYVCVLGWCV